MRSYKITPVFSIEGDPLKEAIEANFARIASHLRLGNVAGYQLHKVWCEYEDDIQAAVLHITACGSDMLVNYDPYKDTPKDYTLTISTSREECPQRIDFELTEGRTFDPFDDRCLTTPSCYYGTLLGLIDEIGLRHCKIREDEKITTLVTCQYPNMSSAFPFKYVEICRARLTRLRPKTDNETTRIMERISELALMIMDCHRNERFESAAIAQAKTTIYFDSLNKITALAKIRADRGMTQTQLADAAQISVRQLQNYEKCPGSTLRSSSKFVSARLADALGVDVSQIVDNDGFALTVNKPRVEKRNKTDTTED